MTQKIKLNSKNKYKLQQALIKAINDINVINSTFNIEDKEIMIPEWLLGIMIKDEVNMIVKKDYNIDNITKLIFDTNNSKKFNETYINHENPFRNKLCKN
jgi:hypothetical protein